VQRFAGLLCGLVAGVAFADGQPRAGRAFGPGEQVKYSVSYLGVVAGSATVTVGAETKQWGQPVWPLVTVARSESVADVYPIRERFVSYWDERGQRTVGSDFYSEENHKKLYQRIRLDGSDKAQVLKKYEGQDSVEETRDVPAQVHDMESVAFVLRNKDLDVGQTYEAPVFTGSKSFVVKGTVEAKETLSTALGAREVFRVRVETDFSGGLAAKRDMLAYFSADARKVPVRVAADFLIGTIVAELVSYEPGRVEQP
jgi:hypothetical protein